MIPCKECGRHLRSSEEACPFCSAPGLGARMLRTVGAVLTPVVLAACYGSAPMNEDTDETDVTETDPADTSDTDVADTDVNDTDVQN